MTVLAGVPARARMLPVDVETQTIPRRKLKNQCATGFRGADGHGDGVGLANRHGRQGASA